jgi:hypothetical protein
MTEIIAVTMLWGSGFAKSTYILRGKIIEN